MLSLVRDTIAAEDLLKAWAPKNEWLDLVRYKAECMVKHKEDIKMRDSYEKKNLANRITKVEKEQRLRLIRQINSRDYRMEKKVLVVLQQAYIKFILAQDGCLELQNEHEKIMDGP